MMRNLPPELILDVLQCLSVPYLLSILTVSKSFHALALKVIEAQFSRGGRYQEAILSDAPSTLLKNGWLFTITTKHVATSIHEAEATIAYDPGLLAQVNLDRNIGVVPREQSEAFYLLGKNERNPLNLEQDRASWTLPTQELSFGLHGSSTSHEDRPCESEVHDGVRRYDLRSFPSGLVLKLVMHRVVEGVIDEATSYIITEFLVKLDAKWIYGLRMLLTGAHHDLSIERVVRPFNHWHFTDSDDAPAIFHMVLRLRFQVTDGFVSYSLRGSTLDWKMTMPTQ